MAKVLSHLFLEVQQLYFFLLHLFVSFWEFYIQKLANIHLELIKFKDLPLHLLLQVTDLVVQYLLSLLYLLIDLLSCWVEGENRLHHALCILLFYHIYSSFQYCSFLGYLIAQIVLDFIVNIVYNLVDLCLQCFQHLSLSFKFSFNLGILRFGLQRVLEVKRVGGYSIGA